MFKEFSLNRMIVLVTTLGFAVLLLDITIEHWEIMIDEIWVYVPIVFSIVIIVLGIITTVKWKEKNIRLFQVFLVLSFLIAGSGLFFHLEDEEDEPNPKTQEREHEENEKDKPIIAPFAFAGLAVIGLLGTSRKWKAEEIDFNKK
jgi:hypothetical protein